MKRHLIYCAAAFCATIASAYADPPTPLSALAKLPVKEITVFKDGHAFVLHEGTLPTDGDGNVQMDYLPTPVLGTFWPYSSDRNVKLTAVVSSPRKALIEKTALTVPDILAANPGTRVTLTMTDGKTVITGVIVENPTRSSAELEATSVPNSGEKLPERSALILVKEGNGVHAVPIDQIRDVSLVGDYKKTISQEEFRNLLSLKLDWKGKQPAKQAAVGMVYVQKGIRWIPSYKMTLDGKGHVEVKLQATLINDLIDLKDATANLVIGVPSFAFKDTPDPISLQQTFSQLSTYFENDSKNVYALSNGIMSQSGGGFGGGRRESARPSDPAEIGPEINGANKNEDLFLFNVKHVTLKKGQRMTLPISEYSLKYKDVYTVELPFAPPRQSRGSFNTDQQAQLAKALATPKAIHAIRIANSSKFPITTAPVLLMNGESVIAQSATSYTSIGGNLDIALTTATDIRVKKSEKETQQTPNAENWNGHQFTKIDLEGTLALTNYSDKEVDLEVTRFVLGQADKADHGGDIVRMNSLDDDEYAQTSDVPTWWGWYNWPYWWGRFNGVGRVKWTTKLSPGKNIELGYKWHYYWE